MKSHSRMTQDKQFRFLNSYASGLVTTKLITYWEKKRPLMYNVNPVTEDRNVRVILLRSLFRG